jgi:hypothetical protein
MTAFDRAAAALAADANLSEAARYLPAGGGAAIPCRVIRYQRDPLTDLGQHHVRQAGWTFMLLISEVAQPAKGAKLQLGMGRKPWEVMPWQGKREIVDVQLDEDMLTHRISVR